MKICLSSYAARCRISVMSCDILDHVEDEIRSNKARVTLQLVESTDVLNCTYLFVYCRYKHAVELKDWVLHVRKPRDD